MKTVSNHGTTSSPGWRLGLLVLVGVVAAFFVGRSFGQREASTQNSVSLAASRRAILKQTTKNALLSQKSPTEIAALVDKICLGTNFNLFGDNSAFRLLALIHLADGADSKQIHALLVALSKHSDDMDIGIVTMMLLQRWADLDPQAAFAWVQLPPENNAGGQERKDRMSLVLSDWALQDPAATLAALDQVQDRDIRKETIGIILGSMAQTNPANAFAILGKLPADQQIPEIYSQIIAQWALQDPAAAVAAALSLPIGQNRASALDGVADGWAQQDPAAALAWVQTLPPGSVSNSAFSSALTRLVQQNPEAAESYLSDLPNDNDRNNFQNQIVQSFAKSDPTMAINYLSQITDPSTLSSAISSLAVTWAQSDHSAALGWLQSLPDSEGSTRSEAISSVVSAWVQTDPANAAAYALANIDDSDFTNVTEKIAMVWGVKDPQATLSWAASLPPGEGRSNAVYGVITDIAGTDPQAAWNYTEQELDGQPQKDFTLEFIANDWINTAPMDALPRIMAMPEGDARANVIGNLAGILLGHDSLAASTWINSLPPGPSHDAAVSRLVSDESKNDPEAAFTWATTIDPSSSHSGPSLATATQQLAAKDPAAAYNAVQAAQLTDAERQTLLTIVQGHSDSQSKP